MPRHTKSSAESLFISFFITIVFGIFIFLYQVYKKKLWTEFFFTALVYIGINYFCFHFMPMEEFKSVLLISSGIYAFIWVVLFNKRRVFKSSNQRLNEQFWRTLDPFAFEEETAELLRDMGHKATVTPERGDYGVDIVANINGIRTAVQCKRYNGHKVSCEEVRELWGSKDYYNCENVVMVGLDGVTENSWEFINKFRKNYKVVTLKDLINYAEGVRSECKNKKSRAVKNYGFR